MIVVPFTVNDAELRTRFLEELYPSALAALEPGTPPVWGGMTAQQMVEHLLSTARLSTGAIVLPCVTPASLLERVKRFLYDDRPMTHDFMNPLLEEGLPMLEYPDLSGAIAALRGEVGVFMRQRREGPEVVRVHPIFGPLTGEEWERIHFKHFHHHMQQFGVIGM
jgi:oxepin-CoA hydrolase / 3-oxo-5,6-dehydrosuberyl-CoA semialdehyde dehydrogenase